MQKWCNQTSKAMASRWGRCRWMICFFPTMILLYGCQSKAPEDTAACAPAVGKPKYEVYTIEIRNMKFVPDSLVVKKGDKIIFVNRDMVNHCVTEAQTKAWTSGIIPSGEDYLLVANRSSNYFCAIHTVMKGAILVK